MCPKQSEFIFAIKFQRYAFNNVISLFQWKIIFKKCKKNRKYPVLFILDPLQLPNLIYWHYIGFSFLESMVLLLRLMFGVLKMFMSDSYLLLFKTQQCKWRVTFYSQMHYKRTATHDKKNSGFQCQFPKCISSSSVLIEIILCVIILRDDYINNKQ